MNLKVGDFIQNYFEDNFFKVVEIFEFQYKIVNKKGSVEKYDKAGWMWLNPERSKIRNFCEICWSKGCPANA